MRTTEGKGLVAPCPIIVRLTLDDAELYKHNMTAADHVRLADTLASARSPSDGDEVSQD